MDKQGQFFTITPYSGKRYAALPPVFTDILRPSISACIALDEKALAAWILVCAVRGVPDVNADIIDWAKRQELKKDTDPRHQALMALAFPRMPLDSFSEEIGGYIAGLHEALAVCIIAAKNTGYDLSEPLLAWAREFLEYEEESTASLFARAAWFLPRLSN